MVDDYMLLDRFLNFVLSRQGMRLHDVACLTWHEATVCAPACLARAPACLRASLCARQLAGLIVCMGACAGACASARLH